MPLKDNKNIVDGGAHSARIMRKRKDYTEEALAKN